MAGAYKLKRAVGPGSDVNADDVWMLKHALRQDGFYSEPKHGMTPYPDRSLFDGIKKFQARHGLRVDGVATPGGETESRLQRQLLAVAKFRCMICSAWHGGVYSPVICYDCWKKATS